MIRRLSLPAAGTPDGLGSVGAASVPSNAMSTRKLIAAALVCGLAILVAFAIQLVLIRS